MSTEFRGEMMYPRQTNIKGATPSIDGGCLFRTVNTGSTTITSFRNMENGQRFFVFVDDLNTAIQPGAALVMGGGAYVAGTKGWIEFIVDKGIAYELYRSVQISQKDYGVIDGEGGDIDIGAANTWEKFDGFQTNGPSSATVTADQGNSRIQVLQAGDYKITVTGQDSDWASASTNSTLDIAIYTGPIGSLVSRKIRNVLAASDTNQPFTLIHTRALAALDVVEFWVRSSDAASSTLEWVGLEMSVEAVG